MPSPTGDAAFKAYYEDQGILELSQILDTLERPLPLDVRVSPRAPLAGRALTLLRALQEEDGRYLRWAQSYQWPSTAPSARQILQRQQLRGALQRQESASMLPSLILNPSGSDYVLDMCAAPGSKSINLLAQMDAPSGVDGSAGAGGGLLIANDASLDRTISLTHRLASVNVASPHAVITSLDGRWWPRQLNLRFDRILCDVPCSGDGTLRKRHKNTPEWTPEFAESLHSTQVGLLRQGLRQLRVGGTLVYSTCSFNPIENEAVVAEALRSMPTRTAFELIDPRLSPDSRHLFRGCAEAANGAASGVGNGAQGGGTDMGTDRSDGLRAAPGLCQWNCPEEAPRSMRPPSPNLAANEPATNLDAQERDDDAWIGELLPRCVRLVPHYDDCGGFFVAVFRRVEETEAEHVTPVDSSEGCASLLSPADDGGPEARDERSDANDGIDGSKSGKDGKGSKGSSYLGDASALVRLPPDSDEWRACLDFYGLRAEADGSLPGQALLWAPGRAAKREKLYLASEGAAQLVSECWAGALARPRGAQRLKGRLHAVGVKAFERLKLTNVRSRAAYSCDWRPCQQALHYLRPRMTRRVLSTSDEPFFASVLTERGVRKEQLHLLDGLDTCTGQDGELCPGGAVLSLVDGESLLASVVCVLSPGGLAVWAPKEEVVGMLSLLNDGTLAAA